MILRSALFSILVTVLGIFSFNYFHTGDFLADLGGLGAFLTVFGTLYGILAAFIVFEVWTQFNQISQLIDKEAQGVERLFRLTLYFRDEQLTTKMEAAIAEYVGLVIEGDFQTVAKGGRNKLPCTSFR